MANHSGPHRAVLTYWDGHGNAEIIRLMLAAVEIPWVEQVYSPASSGGDGPTKTHLSERSDLEPMLTDGVLAFDQVPLLQIDGLNLVQKMAAVRFIARIGRLYGKNEVEAARIDVISEGLLDMATSFRDGVPAALEKYLPRLNRALLSSDGPFLAGKVSFVDIQFFYTIQAATRFVDHPLNGYPELEVLFAAVGTIPGIARYLADPDCRFPYPGRDGYYDRVKATMPWLFGEGGPPAMSADRWLFVNENGRHEYHQRVQALKKGVPRQQQNQPTFAESFAMASCEAILSKLISAPFETLKIRTQVGPELLGGLPPLTLWTAFSGNTLNSVRYFPTQALNFAFKAPVKNCMESIFGRPGRDEHVRRLAMNIVSGGVTGALSLLVVYPLDAWRTQAVVGSPLTPFVESYAGFTESVLGILVYRGMYFGLYDTLVPLVPQRDMFSRFIMGYAVTIGAGVLTYPIDTVRRRMIISPFKYTDGLSCASTIMNNEGVEALFLGCGYNILRGMIGAVVLSGFDSLKHS